MSFSDGWAAINLDMPARVPRTEYSAESHWELVERTTGIHIDANGSQESKDKASSAFRKAWNMDFIWSIMTNEDVYGQHYTRMGHASYSAGGTDYNAEVLCPFSGVEAVLSFDPEQFYQIPDKAKLSKEYELHYEANCRMNPDAVNMTGIYTTCMSGLIAMFGWERLLEALGADPDGFGRVVNSYGRLMRNYFEALAQADVPVVMVHDDLVWTSGPFVHPEWYRKYIFPNIKLCLEPLVESGKKVAFTSDGDFSLFVDDIAACGVSGFVLEPLTDMKYIAERYRRTHFFIGNADTRVLLLGNREEIENEVRRCMEIGKNCPGYFMAVGNHIPSNTPVENALWYNECYERLSKR
jgi:hypothetical protein